MPQRSDRARKLHDATETLIAVDESWRITHVDPAAEERMLAETGRRPRGRLLWDMGEGHFSPSVRGALERAMRERVVVSAEQLLPVVGAPFEVTAHPSETGLILVLREISPQTRRALTDQIFLDAEITLVAASSWREAMRDTADLLLRRAAWPLAEIWVRDPGDALPRLMDVVGDDSPEAHAFEARTREVARRGPTLVVEHSAAQLAPVRINDYDSSKYPRADAARAVGIRSTIHVNLPVEGGMSIVLGFFSRRAGAHDIWLDVFEDAWPGMRALLATRLAQLELARFFEISASGLCVFGADGRFHRVNRAFCDMLGYPPEEILARRYRQFLHPDDQDASGAELRSLETGGGATRFENRWRHRDGSYRVLEWTSVGAPDERRFYATARDVTDDRLASNDLQEMARRVAESEARFRLAASITRSIIWDWDLRTDTVTWSEEYETVSGYRRDQVPADVTMLFELVHPDDREGLHGSIGAALASESGVVEHEYRARHASGEWRIVHIRGTIQRDASGTPLRIVGVMQDVTQQRAAEREIAMNEQRYRILARSTSDAVCDWDLRLDRISWSDGVESLLGVGATMRVMTRDQLARFLHPDDMPRLEGRLRALRHDEGSAFIDEFRMRTAEGTPRLVAWRAEVLRDDTGEPVQLIAGLKDVSARRAADRIIGEQATLLDGASDAIHVRDLSGAILYANRAARALYGVEGELGDHPSIAAYVATSGERARAERVLAEHGEWSGELLLPLANGDRPTVQARWTRIEGDDEHPLRILAIETDVTERKRLEAQFLRAQRLESIGTLAGGIAHDLNNVLAPILLSIDLLKSMEPAPETQPILETLDASARRGADMVRQVLSFARGVSGERAAIAPRDIVSDVERIAREVLPRNLRVVTQVAPDTWPIVGDATQLHQVLLNLVVNARDAMPQGGDLRITARNARIDAQYAAMNADAQVGEFVQLTVADTGVGMAEETRQRIFEPFFTTKPVGQGTGLGLSTVLAIVRSHGGFLNVYSEPGKGSQFRIYFPADTTGTEGAIPPDPVSELPRGHGELILVIDDEASIRTITRQTLEAFGYRVVTAVDGAEAVAIFAQRRQEIAAVLTDMMMPVMDGTMTIAALQRVDPTVRIIAASGLTTNTPPATASGTRVRHFLPKPFTAQSLLQMLRDVLRDAR